MITTGGGAVYLVGGISCAPPLPSPCTPTPNSALQSFTPSPPARVLLNEVQARVRESAMDSHGYIFNFGGKTELCVFGYLGDLVRGWLG